MPITHVINFSGGVCSFWAAKRTLDKHGRENCVLLFADTCMEDEDLYRFNRDAEAYLGVQLIRLSRELTPWQLFRQKHKIGNDRSPICSILLKRDLLNAWQTEHAPTATLVIGMDWEEEDRLARMRSKYPHLTIEAPMMAEPVWDKCRMLAELKSIGIRHPRLYDAGFSHNNCGGFCVRAGHAHFAHLYRWNRELYSYHEEQERLTNLEFRQHGMTQDYSILTDRRGGPGPRRPITLAAFRSRIESGEYDHHEWGGCGCSLE